LAHNLLEFTTMGFCAVCQGLPAFRACRQLAGIFGLEEPEALYIQ